MLDKANLRGANLSSADLSYTNLSYTNLSDANLRSANLHYANLSYANLSGANLRDANLRDAHLPPFQIPQEGELIVWKSLRGGLAKLRIPPAARRTASLVGRKCRAEFAEVLELPTAYEECASMQDQSIKYRLGEVVKPDSYNEDVRLECTNGIHFFLTREEAEAWQ